jgi:hypothetical protein
MLKHGLAVVMVSLLAGCASMDSTPPAKPAAVVPSQSSDAIAQGQSSPSPAELAAYAGAHPYPTSLAARDDLKAAAIVNADTGIIKIYNFSSQAIREADVWVNQGFVRHINAIPPGSSITLQMSNLYNGVGQQFSARAEHVNLVQVQTDHDMQTLWGPAPQ